jgi:DNA repair protein RadC
LEDRAVSIMLVHNHPSGNTDPSESHIAATRRLLEVGKTIGIPVLDHIVVTAEKHLSIREYQPSLFAGC